MIRRGYRFIQILSIDIVIGVVILLRFFCVQFEVNVGWEVYALLASAVWLIYTADHLRDAEKSKKSNRERYVFHRRNKKALTLTSMGVLIFSAPLVFYIPVIIFIGGLALAILSLIYLLVQHRLSVWFSKELYVAIIYSCGILMVPMLMSMTSRWEYLIILFILTFINLIIFSWYEKSEDESDGFTSIATQLSERTLDRLIYILLAFGLGMSFLSFGIVHLYFQIGFLIYSLMILTPNRFRPNQLYRVVGDGVFLLPIAMEWL